MTPCPPVERLGQFLAEELPPAAADEVEDHLTVCAACRQRLEELTCDESARRLRELYQNRERTTEDTELFFLRDLPPPPRADGGDSPLSGADSDTPPGDEGAGPATATLPRVPGYDVLGELGRGGMGVVYKARHLRLNRLVALKMILGGGLAGPVQRTRFLVEAETLARLRHPNVVQIHEINTHEGCPFFALEYIDGGTLADRLDAGALPPAEAAALVETLARAVHAAHLQGVIHRDLKPANVLLSAKGEPKITDFGLAKLVVGHPELTQTGVVAGTPAYMAPEQASGDSRAITPAVDVYALGAILYQALMGQPPFKGEEAARVIARLTAGDVPSLGKLAGRLPRDLVTICTRCLEPEPSRRYASAEALADDLGRYRRGEPIRARSVGDLERLWMWARRRRALAGALAGLALALVAGTAISTYFAVVAGRRETQAQAARRQAEAQAARAEFTRGFDLAAQGEDVRGLHGMLNALRRAPPPMPTCSASCAPTSPSGRCRCSTSATSFRPRGANRSTSPSAPTAAPSPCCGKTACSASTPRGDRTSGIGCAARGDSAWPSAPTGGGCWRAAGRAPCTPGTPPRGRKSPPCRPHPARTCASSASRPTAGHCSPPTATEPSGCGTPPKGGRAGGPFPARTCNGGCVSAPMGDLYLASSAIACGAGMPRPAGRPRPRRWTA